MLRANRAFSFKGNTIDKMYAFHVKKFMKWAHVFVFTKKKFPRISEAKGNFSSFPLSCYYISMFLFFFPITTQKYFTQTNVYQVLIFQTHLNTFDHGNFHGIDKELAFRNFNCWL